MTPPEVRWDRDGPVVTITLCRPDVLNAQTPQTWAQLRAIANELPAGVRVVVLRGAGRSFSAGLDTAAAPALLADLAQRSPEQIAERIAGFQEAFSWLRRPDLITIAAVQGHALGAGFQLALACDLRILAADASLAMAEVTLGLVPDLGGTKRLVELVGYARALEICVTGRRIDAAEADRIGLATVVVPRADLDAAVADLTAAVLAAGRQPATEIKALLSAAAGRAYPDQERAEREAQARRIQDLAGLGE